jgi:hypothetical protein
MSKRTAFKLATVLLAVVLLALALTPSEEAARAQGQIVPLRVEEAVTGQLTAEVPTAVYSFSAVESLRMAVVFDVIEGDMRPTLVVLDQDQKTTLAGSVGMSANGVIVTFPATGTYYLGLTASEGTSATYRLMISADPALPVDTFVLQSYLVKGTSTVCEENTPVGQFTPTEDINVCFVLFNVTEATDLKIEWWSPSGTIATEENGSVDASVNGRALLSGIVYPNQPLEEGWWQAHILLNGELAYIQWVPVLSQ